MLPHLWLTDSNLFRICASDTFPALQLWTWRVERIISAWEKASCREDVGLELPIGRDPGAGNPIWIDSGNHHGGTNAAYVLYNIARCKAHT